VRAHRGYQALRRKLAGPPAEPTAQAAAVVVTP